MICLLRVAGCGLSVESSNTYIYNSAAIHTHNEMHYHGDAEAVWHIDVLEGAFKELL